MLTANLIVQSALAVLLLLCQVNAGILSIFVNVSSTSVLQGEVIQLFYMLNTNNTNITAATWLYPYINNKSFGSEVAPQQILASGAAVGNAWIPLPWSLVESGSSSTGSSSSSTTTATLFLAIHAPPTGPTLGNPPPSTNIITSNVITLQVTPRIPSLSLPNQQQQQQQQFPLTAMYIETWFTPLNFFWTEGNYLAEAIPSMGRYASVAVDGIIQHAAEYIQSGVDALVIDWTNNVWNTPTWEKRGPNIQELVNATDLYIGVFADLKHRLKWTAIPQFILLLGLNNGPITPMPALMGELDYIVDAYIGNASVGADMFVSYLGKPLVIIFDGTGADHSTFTHPNFTVRWMSSQNQNTNFNKKGYWSWMDGTIDPLITVFDGVPEAATAAPAFFVNNGWTDATSAMGRSGGLSYVQSVANVLQGSVAIAAANAATANTTTTTTSNTNALISFLFTCQWNEFAGQANGAGYGPTHGEYVDSFSADLSNDMEPTSLFACGYSRPGYTCGGWGYRQLNILKMMNLASKQPSVLDSTVMVSVLSPAVGDISNYTDSPLNTEITITWAVTTFSSKSLFAGSSYTSNASSYTLPLLVSVSDPVDVTNASSSSSSHVVAIAKCDSGLCSFTLNVDEAGVNGTAWDRTFPHILTLTAQPSVPGATDNLTPFPLSIDYVDEGAPLTVNPVAASTTVWIRLPESLA